MQTSFFLSVFKKQNKTKNKRNFLSWFLFFHPLQLHVPIINKSAIRLLTKMLIEAALYKNKIDEKYLVRSKDILKEYIGGEQKKDLQLESLYAIQLLSNELVHPSGK